MRIREYAESAGVKCGQCKQYKDKAVVIECNETWCDECDRYIPSDDSTLCFECLQKAIELFNATPTKEE